MPVLRWNFVFTGKTKLHVIRNCSLNTFCDHLLTSRSVLSGFKLRETCGSQVRNRKQDCLLRYDAVCNSENLYYCCRLRKTMWPWQSRRGNSHRLMFVTSNRCIQFKRTTCWIVVVLCACELIPLPSVVLYIRLELYINLILGFL